MNCPAPFSTRSEQTRDRIMAAFTHLVFNAGFERVSVRALVAAAHVARSTFYEHFSGKDDVLRACMAPFLEVIANSVCNDDAPAELEPVLAHLWDKRRLTDAIFSGPPRVILARALGERVEIHLRAINRGERLALPYRLAAIHLAEGQLALVESWLRGRAFCEVNELAAALHRSSRASARALLAPAVRHCQPDCRR